MSLHLSLEYLLDKLLHVFVHLVSVHCHLSESRPFELAIVSQENPRMVQLVDNRAIELILHGELARTFELVIR